MNNAVEFVTLAINSLKQELNEAQKIGQHLLDEYKIVLAPNVDVLKNKIDENMKKSFKLSKSIKKLEKILIKLKD